VLLYLGRDAGKRSSSMGEIRVDQLVPISWDVDQMGTTFCITMERVNIRGDWWFGGHTVRDNHEPVVILDQTSKQTSSYWSKMPPWNVTLQTQR